MGSFGWGFLVGVLFTAYAIGSVAAFLAENSLKDALLWPWYFGKEVWQDIRSRFRR